MNISANYYRFVFLSDWSSEGERNRSKEGRYSRNSCEDGNS